MLKAMTGSETIPLRAAFLGLRGLPWIALASSDVRARLVLHPDGVEHRVALRTERRRYADILVADYRSAWRTENVELVFRNSPLTFTGNTGDRKVAAHLLRGLKARGVPLSPRAERLLVGGQ